MSHLILYGELADRRNHGRGEGTCGQETPGRGAGRLHYYQCMRLHHDQKVGGMSARFSVARELPFRRPATPLTFAAGAVMSRRGGGPAR